MLMSIFPSLDAVLVTLNVPSLANLSDQNPDSLDLPTKDYRQDFVHALVKFGFLESQALFRALGLAETEIPPLIDVKEITDDASDFMDEEGAIERIIERLGKLDGNQSVVVAAIVEVFSFSGKADLAY